MRVLFAASLITALVTAGGAPAPKGNTAKRNVDQHLAPHRFDKTEILIPKGQAKHNDGKGELSLQVVLKADDDNRAQQELHTTLTLDVDGLEEGMEVNLGWAMKLTPSADIVKGPDAPEGFLDGQGTEVSELQKRAQVYPQQKANWWDGVNAWAVYNGESGSGMWTAQEIWQDSADNELDGAPDVYNNGLAALTYEEINNFIVFQDYSEIKCDATTLKDCQATVVTERIWDTEETTTGHRIESKMERAYSFTVWYQVYSNSCPVDPNASDAPERRLQGEVPVADTRLSDNGADACYIKGQSSVTGIFVLGAVSGIAAAAAAILSTMLF